MVGGRRERGSGELCALAREVSCVVGQVTDGKCVYSVGHEGGMGKEGGDKQGG